MSEEVIIIETIMWAYMQGYTDAINLLQTTKPEVSELKKMFMDKILKEKK